MTTSPAQSLCNTKYFAIWFFPSVILIVSFADVLFYGKRPGISVAVFSSLLWILLALNQPQAIRTTRLTLPILLTFGALFQASIETSFSNILVIASLLFIGMGEVFYSQLQPTWARWTESVIALLKAPGRWPWLVRTWSLPSDLDDGKSRDQITTWTWIFQILLPAALVLVPFILLLGSGNAIIGLWLRQGWDVITHWLQMIEFPEFKRILFWLAVATLGLAFLRPSTAPASRGFWNRKPPVVAAPDTNRLRHWRALVMLIATNVLFLAANTTDAVYLWRNAELPKGVSFSDFLHSGVNSLTITVLLSAFVIVLIFEKDQGSFDARSILGLSLVWILQDLFLVSSVLLRLKLYVGAYQLSTLRVYVCFFLLLVSTGFVLLAFYILKHKSFRWLFFSNVIATFILFYTVQFTDTSGWVADYNVRQWELNPGKALDVPYLSSLGPSAWPALLKVAASKTHYYSEAGLAHCALHEALNAQADRTAREGWVSWQWRSASLADRISRDIQKPENKP